jgi:hypothetical protein
LITKAIIKSINAAGNRCIVRMPLFETAANPNPVEAEALVNIAPGLFNSLAVGDVVFVAFEENAIDKPIIIGKLFRGADIERAIRGGAGVFDALKVNSTATLPASTAYAFPAAIQNNYVDLNTPKKTADYIKWLENLTKKLAAQLDDNFKCFKNWTQWQLQPENVEIDDGDLDELTELPEPCQYQKEGSECKICDKACTKNKKRSYSKLAIDKKYPEA